MFHAAFWETAGWTPEAGYQGFSDEDGPTIPAYLKGKGRAMAGVNTPKEQDSSGLQPGVSTNGCAPLTSSFIDTG